MGEAWSSRPFLHHGLGPAHPSAGQWQPLTPGYLCREEAQLCSPLEPQLPRTEPSLQTRRQAECPATLNKHPLPHRGSEMAQDLLTESGGGEQGSGPCRPAQSSLCHAPSRGDRTEGTWGAGPRPVSRRGGSWV